MSPDKQSKSKKRKTSPDKQSKSKKRKTSPLSRKMRSPSFNRSRSSKNNESKL